MENELRKRIILDGTINTRDLGGHVSSDGRKIKYNRLIRTDALINISDKDISYIHDVLKGRYEVDMRSYSEVKEHPNKTVPGMQFVHLPIQEDLNEFHAIYPHEEYVIPRKDVAGTVQYMFRMDPKGDLTNAFEKVYREFLAPFGQKQYAKFLRLCLENKEGSILFHCADGKDRSGVGCAILLSALGIDREEIIKDYLKTNENIKEKADERVSYLRNECHVYDEIVLNSVHMIAGVRRNWLEAAFDEMEKQGGNMLGFLTKNLGFTEAEIEELKNNYLE